MALIKCKECGNEVSSKAETCPKCGARVAAKRMGCGTLIGVVFLGLIIIGVISSIFTPSAKNSTTANTSGISSASNQNSPAPTPKIPGSQWYYSQDNDEMGKGKTYQALVYSTNMVEFGFPYAGKQYGTLGLRIHPRYGKDIIFKIERGQLLCRSYDGCNVLVRFDDEPSINFSASSAADNSTETIFIQNYSKFIDKLSRAKKVRISVNVYQEGSPVFEFDVSGFDRNKYVPKS